jgi:hypothetical protein
MTSKLFFSPVSYLVKFCLTFKENWHWSVHFKLLRYKRERQLSLQGGERYREEQAIDMGSPKQIA